MDFEDFKFQLSKINDKNTCAKRKGEETEIGINTVIEDYFYYVFNKEYRSLIRGINNQSIRFEKYNLMKNEYRDMISLFYRLGTAINFDRLKELYVYISLFEYIGNRKIESIGSPEYINKKNIFNYVTKLNRDIEIKYGIDKDFYIHIIFPNVEESECEDVIEHTTLKFAGFYLIITVNNMELRDYLLQYSKVNKRFYITSDEEITENTEDSNKKIKI